MEEYQENMKGELSNSEDPSLSATSAQLQEQIDNVHSRLAELLQKMNDGVSPDLSGPSTSRGLQKQNVINPECQEELHNLFNYIGQVLEEIPANKQQGGWKKKTLPSQKSDDKKGIRLRRNARLRKLLLPKTALAALNEMLPDIKYMFLPEYNTSPSEMIVHAEVKGEIYTGNGTSKSLAKQDLANKALRKFFLEKILESPESARAQPRTAMEVDDDSLDSQWKQLACFAIYNLGQVWQSKTGTSDLECEPLSKKRKLEQKVGKNLTDMDAVCLLNNLSQGGATFREGPQTDPTVFNMKVTVDGVTYKGAGATKKHAKRSAAVAALADRFGVIYH